MTFPVTAPFAYFPNRDGGPLTGLVYLGEEDQNPQTHPISVYWDSALTITATQPLQVSGGYIYRNGTPANIFVGQACSMTVRSTNGALVYSTPSLESGLAFLSSSDGSSLVGFIQSGTGAIATNVQAELRTFVRPEQFGTIVSNVTDATTAINNAMLRASQGHGPGYVLFDSSKIYIAGQLVPQENVTLIVGGATLKLKDNTEEPLFYDNAVVNSPYKRNFAIEGGIFDCNKANNNSTNHSGGFLWLTNWTNVRVVGPKIKNCFKDTFLFAGCEGIYLEINEPIEDCGQVNGGGFFAYGAVFTDDASNNHCKNIKINGFPVLNHYGFGMHFFECEGYEANNLDFEDLTQSGQAIAITCTQAKRGKLTNIRCKDVDGDNIEFNANEDLEVENVRIDSSGDIPIIFGDNGSGASNKRMTLRNVETVSTGGSVSLRHNYTTDVKFEHCTFDKAYDLTAALPRTNVRFEDCTWAVALFSNATQINEIWHRNSKFTNWTLIEYERNTIRAAISSTPMAIAAVLDVDMSLFDRALTGGTGNGGRIRTTTAFQANFAQGSYQYADFFHFGTTLNIAATVNAADGSVARLLTYAADAANQKITLTNGTGAALNAAVVLDIVTGSP